MVKYSQYKDSKITWVGDIPNHWSVNRLSSIGNLYGGLSGKSGDDFIDGDLLSKPYIPFTNISKNIYISKNHFKKVKISPTETQNLVKKFDLFFLMSSENYEDLGKTSLLTEDADELYLNSFCKGFRITNQIINPHFLNYLLLGNSHRKLISIEGNGFTRINLRSDRLKNLPILIPPIEEQKTISKFLDHKIELIDVLLEKILLKIDLLNEQKNSFTNHIITKGLNPQTQLKDSGIESIGKIPYNWTVSKLKHVANIFGRIGYRGYTVNDIVSKEEGCVVLGPGNIVNNELQFDTTTYLAWNKYFESPEIMIFRNDIVFVKTGSTIGKTCLVNSDEKMTLNPQMVVLKNIKLDNQYLFYLTTCSFFQSHFFIEQSGGSTPTISQEKILNFPILIPPKEEQINIANSLKKKHEYFSKLIKLNLQRLEKLKEYRNALISSAVTGKIKITEDML